MSNRLHAARGRRAFTMIELLSALAILGVGVVALMFGLHDSLEAQRRLQDHATADGHSCHGTSFPDHSSPHRDRCREGSMCGECRAKPKTGARAALGNVRQESRKAATPGRGRLVCAIVRLVGAAIGASRWRTMTARQSRAVHSLAAGCSNCR